MSSSRVPGLDGTWIKARLSAGGSECVELRRHGGLVEVRDSKDRDGPVLRFARSELRALLDGVAGGGFGRLAEG